MKLEASRIRSAEMIRKPDGLYCRIGYVKNPPGNRQWTDGIRRLARRTWENRYGKAAIIALALAAAANLLLKLVGM